MDNSGYELATTLIAAYGAVVATLSFILAIVLGILELKRHKPQLRVTATHGTIIDPIRGTSESLILMEAVNLGTNKVTLTAVGWLLNNKHKLQFTRPYMMQLPYELDPGKEVTTFWPCRLFQEHEDNESIVAVFFSDATGKMWKGKVERKQRRIWLNAKEKGWRIF
jgi:hypothetical protein